MLQSISYSVWVVVDKKNDIYACVHKRLLFHLRTFTISSLLYHPMAKSFVLQSLFLTLLVRYLMNLSSQGVAAFGMDTGILGLEWMRCIYGYTDTWLNLKHWNRVSGLPCRNCKLGIDEPAACGHHCATHHVATVAPATSLLLFVHKVSWASPSGRCLPYFPDLNGQWTSEVYKISPCNSHKHV